MAAANSQHDAKPDSVAILGAGLMGGRMAARLASQGYSTAAWTRSGAAKLAAENSAIHAATSAAEAVGKASVVLLMLSDAAAIQGVLLDDAAVKSQLPGRTMLMMSTIGPAESKRLAADVTAAGATYIECPVLGSLPEVTAGTLQVLVGSEPELAQDSPGYRVLCGLTDKPRQIGGFGAASAMKLALNQLIVSETLAFSASLGLVRKLGGDGAVDNFMDVLRASALYAPTFDKKLGKYMSQEFAGSVNFPTKHLLKDARLFCVEAEAAGLDARMQRAAEGLCETACDMPGLVDADYSSVYMAVVNPPAAHADTSAPVPAAAAATSNN